MEGSMGVKLTDGFRRRIYTDHGRRRWITGKGSSVPNANFDNGAWGQGRIKTLKPVIVKSPGIRSDASPIWAREAGPSRPSVPHDNGLRT